MSHINQLSEQLLLAVKIQQDASHLIKQLADLPYKEIDNQLINDSHKKAFWINVYNAFFQVLRKTKQLDKPQIYREQHIVIANKLLSLDDIEHGILRQMRYKNLADYTYKLTALEHIKNCAVQSVDYRIHFALNCGAVSCPPIAFYTVKKLDAQLEMAADAFLNTDTKVDQRKKEVHATSLFDWFSIDFGGTAGIHKILSERINQDLTDYSLVYKPYSWEELLDNYG